MKLLRSSLIIILFVAVTSGNSVTSETKSDTKVEETAEAGSKSSATENSTTYNGQEETTPRGKLREKDGNDLATAKDMSLEVMIEEIIAEDKKVIQEENQQNSQLDKVDDKGKDDDDDDNPENPIESKISSDFIKPRRQTENSEVKQENSSPAIQYDDANIKVTSDPLKRYGQRKFRQKVQDVPHLQLTQGGYERPYKHPRFRSRYSPRADSSEQSKSVQQSDQIPNKKNPDTSQIVSQVTYIPSLQSPYPFGQGPFLNSPFDTSSRNMLALNQILPPSAQNEFFNSPPAEFTGYGTNAFQPQFAPSNNIGGIPNFSRDPNNAGVYQTMSSQTPRNLFQNLPQIHPQSMMTDAGRNAEAQFQQNPMPTYSGYEIMEDNSTPNYASFFRNPAVFQVPSNFYSNSPNAMNPLNNPPINFVSRYPNFDDGVQSQPSMYPLMTSGVQNNQQYSNNQPIDNDASQDGIKAKVVAQNVDKPINRDDPIFAPFGTSLPAGNIANVYMRYPTVEAGYAIVENLPARNHSDESKEDTNRSNEQTNSPPSDIYRNVLNTLLNNQRSNNSFDFLPEFYRNPPSGFRHQRPQDGIVSRYADRNRGIPNYASPNFESRIPFNTVASIPENLLRVNNQQHIYQESNETPSCAKDNDTSVCFEDSEYPKNDIMYTIRSNSFLAERLLNLEPSLNKFAFMKSNTNETEQNEEKYACDVDIKYGMPLRAKNLAGIWRIIINVQEKFSQPVRMEVCKSLGSSCSYADTRIKTACVQKYSLQRMLTWSSSRGIYSDVYKIPVACSCQIIETAEN